MIKQLNPVSASAGRAGRRADAKAQAPAGDQQRKEKTHERAQQFAGNFIFSNSQSNTGLCPLNLQQQLKH